MKKELLDEFDPHDLHGLCQCSPDYADNVIDLVTELLEFYKEHISCRCSLHN